MTDIRLAIIESWDEDKTILPETTYTRSCTRKLYVDHINIDNDIVRYFLKSVYLVFSN